MILDPAGSSRKAIATVFDEIVREKIVAGEETDVEAGPGGKGLCEVGLQVKRYRRLPESGKDKGLFLPEVKSPVHTM